VIFEDGTDYRLSRQQVGERLAQAAADMPAGVIPVLGPEAAATGQIFWYTVEAASRDLATLRSVQDWYIKPQLSAVPGVAEVASVGGYAAEFQVELHPERMQVYGVDAGHVVRAVARANSAVGGQALQEGNAEHLVHSAGWMGLSSQDNNFDPRQVV